MYKILTRGGIFSVTYVAHTTQKVGRPVVILTAYHFLIKDYENACVLPE